MCVCVVPVINAAQRWIPLTKPTRLLIILLLSYHHPGHSLLPLRWKTVDTFHCFVGDTIVPTIYPVQVVLCNLGSVRVGVGITASLPLEVMCPVHCRVSSYAAATVAAITGNNNVCNS